jgi:hypothetical protein
MSHRPAQAAFFRRRAPGSPGADARPSWPALQPLVHPACPRIQLLIQALTGLRCVRPAQRPVPRPTAQLADAARPSMPALQLPGPCDGRIRACAADAWPS